LRAQGYADGHPELEKLLIEQKNLGHAVEEKIASKVTSLDRQSNQAYDALQAQADLLRSRLGAASAERASIEKNLREIRKVSSASPEINAKMDELIRQKEEATRQYSLLFDRMKKAEIRLELERVSATSRYQTVIPARLESPPNKKALLLRIMLGLVLGAVIAAAALAIHHLRAIMRKVSGEPTLIGLVLILSGVLSQGCVPHGNFIWVQNLTQTDTTAEPLIHPRDTVLVEVQKQPTLSGEFLVRDDGHYTQPLVGSIKIAGMTTGQAALKVGTALKDIVVNPSVAIWLTKISPIKVSVVGEVKTPGTYELTRTRNVLTALAAAGWVTDFAQKDEIFVVRPDNTRIRFRLRDITASEPIAAAFRLNDADVVVVE
jgi:polysaccharide export outer membrane protein